MMRPGTLTIALVLACLTGTPVPAQEQPADEAQLAAAAREAANNFRPIEAQDVARQRAELAKAMSNLDAFLKTGAAYKSVGWKR